MSYVFLASIAAAIAAPLLWIGLSGELAALAPIGVNALVANSAIVVFLVGRFRSGEQEVAPAIGVAAMHAIAGLLLFRWFRQRALVDPRPMPRIVRIAFMAFATILVVAGAALILQVPKVFPWNLLAENSTVFGCIFIGAATYFIYGVVRARWAFAAGQLWGFLAYDIVLVIPYAQMLAGSSATTDDYGYGNSINMPSLVVYMGVLGASAALAGWMLITHRPGARPGVSRSGVTG